MKNQKARVGLTVFGALFTVALYIYSIYSAYYCFKHGNTGEIILYASLLGLCAGVFILLYTLTDKKHEHTKRGKTAAPLITVAVNIGLYLAAGYAGQKLVSPKIGGNVAASVSMILFGVTLAVFLNGLSSRRLKVFCKISAAACCLTLISTGLWLAATTLTGYSYLKPFYGFFAASKNIGGIPTSDREIVYDFGYATEKPLRDTALGTDESIEIRLAKNEWEAFHVFFATAAKNKKVSVSVTDFKNGDGDSLKTQAYKENYLPALGQGDIFTSEYADALIPVYHTGEKGGPAELKKGLQQGFLIRTFADKNAKAGEYTAVVTAKNENDEVILEKEIKAAVWNFVLPDTPANDTLFGNGAGAFYDIYGVKKGDGDGREKVVLDVYNTLLENHISPYDIPYDILDDRADAYMNDPRVKRFIVPYSEDDETLVKYYSKLKSNPEWAKKAVFYPIDEPGDSDAYARYTEMTDRLNRLCPGYNMVTPFNTDKVKIDGEEKSSVKLQSGRSNILCGMNSVVDRGAVLEEMLNEVKNGSSAWWYVCCAPGGDYCNFFEHLDAIKHRILMWQQKSMDLTGLLYWSTVYCEKANPWLSSKTWDDYDASGDGMLLYPGGFIGLDEVVISLRLVNIADGMEDYDYFALAEQKFGRKWVDDRISKVTTSPTEYITDHALFEQIRREIGEAINAE